MTAKTTTRHPITSCSVSVIAQKSQKFVSVRVSRAMHQAVMTTALSAVLGLSPVLLPPMLQSAMPVAVSGQAQAASNLMDLFRQKREERQKAQQQVPQRGTQVQPAQQRPLASIDRGSPAVSKPVASARPASVVQVRGPQVYDYRPEKLVKIDFTTFDMQLTAATAPADASAKPEAVSLIVPSEVLGEITRTAANLQQQARELIQHGDRQDFAAAMVHIKTLDIRAEQSIAEAVSAFYAAEQQLIWSDGLQVSQRAKDVLELMERADQDGLEPQEYLVTEPSDDFDAADREARLRDLSDFDVRLSARVLRYALDAGEGRVIADRLSGFHDLPRNRIKLDAIIKSLAHDADPVAVLSALHPHNDYYNKLKAQLADMQPVADKSQRVAANTLIKPGQSHAELPKILALIARKAPAGYINSYQDVFDRHMTSDVYDEELVAAIKNYQKLMNKAPDGVIGPATIAALQGESTSVKRERILYAMERLRWLPRDFGTRYVFVNQPAYRAQYFDQGKEQLAMDVVVGSARHQTHFFYDTIQTVVFNPSWGVPRSIVMNEMMPRILADSSYLDRNNYEVISGGKRVSSSAVNWSAVASGKAHVGVRQKPGPSNALGELKIMFPNSHDIYLHDTPSKAAFKRDMRAVSHGCIRLADPRAMASAVMGTQQEGLTKYFGKNERGIKVPSGVPIYLTYFTAWPEENSSKIRYYDDIYERDAGLEKAFAKTAQSRAKAEDTSI